MVINYGLIGCGGAGINRHLPAIQANPRTTLLAVCDLDEERATSVADREDIKSYIDAEAMIEGEELDAVSIATPPQTHRDVLDQIAVTGVDVLIEKPFATTLDDAHEMLESMGDDQRITEVNNQLFQPVVKRAAEAVERGDIGDVEQVYTHSSMPDSENFLQSHPDWITSLPGSVFGENLPHWIYLTRKYIGYIEKTDLNVSESARNEKIPFDEVVVQARGKDANGEIRMTVDTTSSNFIIVVGDSGSLVVDLDNRVNYITDSTSSPVDVLINNFSTAGEIVSQTLQRAVMHGITIGLRRVPFDGRTRIADEGYRTDGHYQQITELVAPDGTRLTVTKQDILNNVRTYESIVNSIEDKTDV